MKGNSQLCCKMLGLSWQTLYLLDRLKSKGSIMLYERTSVGKIL